VLYRVVEGFHVVALHNRYAPEGSREYPPTRVRGRYTAYCPIDLVGGGTWFGFNDAGLFCAVTDQHTRPRAGTWRSRGLLVMDVLCNYGSAEEAVDYVARDLKRGPYKKGNFVVADADRCYHVLFDEDVVVRELDRGVHVFTNLMLGPGVRLDEEAREALERAEKRGKRARELAEGLAGLRADEVIRRLTAIAADHAYGRSEYSICYHGSRGWIMTSSTIAAVAHSASSSRLLYCSGNPCESRFVDYSHAVTGAKELAVKSTRLAGRRIALCLTGSVACILAPRLARELRRLGAEVTCFMTRGAVEYGVSPRVMEWATGRSVVTGLTGMAEHIEDYDLVVVYPATLNTVCKAARGIADNAVTTLLAATPPNRLVLAPTMNLKLFGNPVFRECLDRLRSMGAMVVEPEFGEGAAKAPRIDVVVDHCLRALSTSKLRGRGVLLLAGPTRYSIDAVRFISNRSTGRLGYWLAREAFRRGCRVSVVYGPGVVKFPPHIPVTSVETTEDMLREALSRLESDRFDIAIFAAAILDFKPEAYVDEKIRSGRELTIRLVPTPKVVEAVRRSRPDLFLVTFKLEYRVGREELVARAEEEMKRYRADIVVANDIARVTEETHEAVILTRDGSVREFRGSKTALAAEIFDAIEALL